MTSYDLVTKSQGIISQGMDTLCLQFSGLGNRRINLQLIEAERRI